MNIWSFYKMKQDGSNVNMVGHHNVNEEKEGILTSEYKDFKDFFDSP